MVSGDNPRTPTTRTGLPPCSAGSAVTCASEAEATSACCQVDHPDRILVHVDREDGCCLVPAAEPVQQTADRLLRAGARYAAGQLDLYAVQKRIDLAFVVTPLSNRWLGERHIVKIRWSNTTRCRRISQRCLNALEKRVNLVFVVAAFSPGRLREGHVVDNIWTNYERFT